MFCIDIHEIKLKIINNFILIFWQILNLQGVSYFIFLCLISFLLYSKWKPGKWRQWSLPIPTITNYQCFDCNHCDQMHTELRDGLTEVMRWGLVGQASNRLNGHWGAVLRKRTHSTMHQWASLIASQSGGKWENQGPGKGPEEGSVPASEDQRRMSLRVGYCSRCL